ncbi:MAG: ATP-binding protein [Treponema sp.]|nr:ATP-binding protein [Treponema sp.]
MFIGRKEELSMLEEAYSSGRFEFLVLYGRRRIGKTSLLKEFSSRHKTLLYSAQEKNDALNLLDFSKSVQDYFEGRFFGAFADWEAAFSYITGRAKASERLVLVIDEFPFIAMENPSIKSILQHTIDHGWNGSNIFLILCGSSISFMEDEVLAHKSPLFGRSTMHLELKSFDYLQSVEFFPGYKNEDKLLAYGILGGVPCYLDAFDGRKGIRENVALKILREGSFLKDEPLFLLRQELREPAVYNSIFEAIAGGSTRINDIASKIHEEPQKCAKYLRTLQAIRLVKKSIPCGEDDSSRKSVYGISDNFFLFWYHFLFERKSYFELIGAEKSSEEIFRPENMNTYMGHIFEGICLEYMLRLARLGRLPFVPEHYGRWWGNNPVRKTQDDIDVLMRDRAGERIVICECKYRNEQFGKVEFETMLSRRSIFPHAREIWYYAFSKSGFSGWVRENEAAWNVTLVSIDDMFSDSVRG